MPEKQRVNRSALREFIVETFLFGDDSSLKDDTSFMDAGVLDSMGILRVVDFIERTYGVKLKDGQFIPENLDSIERIARFLSQTLAKSSSELAAESC